MFGRWKQLKELSRMRADFGLAVPRGLGLLNPLKIGERFLGSQNERRLLGLMPIVKLINSLEPQMQRLSDRELRMKTDEFKQRIKERFKEIEPELERLEEQFDQSAVPEEKEKIKGRRKQLKNRIFEEVLPEAFAVVREAGRRTINMRHFDVQLMGGIVLHQGKISEMVTGEGKTLVATLPAYLNALVGEGVHIVTVNDYLAKRDREWMSPIYEFLGLSCGVIQHDMGPEERKRAYACDVTYGTNNEFGFDYLRDNMVIRKEDMAQRRFHFGIVDEVDSILIDEARTPLIISGPTAKTNLKFVELKPEIERIVRLQDRFLKDLIKEAKKLLFKSETEYEGAVKLLTTKRGKPKNKELFKLLEDKDVYKLVGRVESDYTRDKRLSEIDDSLYYSIDEKGHTVVLSDKGRCAFSSKYQKIFLPEDSKDASIFDTERLEYEHVKDQLFRAYELFESDVDYVIKDGEVLIVDEFTGRLMPGRRWSDGLHEAVEAKEGVKPRRESQTLATITFQNYFRMYEKLAGMTGTAQTEAMEFQHIYNLEVVVIPTNEPLIRRNFADVIYKTGREKFGAIVEEIEELYKEGRPVLVGTISIEKSERLSRLLKQRNIPHNILNAKHHELEAHIVAQAGRLHAVTIATNMAGRGTDILLGGNPESLARDLLARQMASGKVIQNEGRTKIFAEIGQKAAREHEEVVKLGGLHIIGTERHEARRIDNQLRGRAGRQGDPGSSRFYLSLEDDLMRLFGSDRIANIMDRLGMEEGQEIQHPLVTRSIETAQNRVEAINFDTRKWLLEYDNIMNRQREVIYNERRIALESQDLRDHIFEMIDETLTSALTTYVNPDLHREDWDFEGLARWIRSRFSINVEGLGLDSLPMDRMKQAIVDRITDVYDRKQKSIGDEVMRGLERSIMLQVIDSRWKDHLYEMDSLKEGIQLRAYGQRDPLVEFQHEGFKMFSDMIQRIKEEVVEFIFKVQAIHEERKVGILDALAREFLHPEAQRMANLPVGSFEETQGFEPSPVAVQGPGLPRESTGVGHPLAEKGVPYRRQRPKIGRNDPCPCGSGKKYKHCCGR